MSDHAPHDQTTAGPNETSPPRPTVGDNPLDAMQPWRSLDELARDDAFVERVAGEFPARASELFEGSDEEALEVSRRSFLSLMGGALALAGLTTSGCIRKPEQLILPFTRRPEDLVPGKPVWYASALRVGGTALGVLVETQDGRPTKVEGNRKHPNSLGGTNAWAQASVLELYGPARSRAPLHDGHAVDWATVLDEIDSALKGLEGAQGEKLAIMTDARPSPTFRRLLGEIRRRFPRVRFYLHDAAEPWSERDGLGLVGLPDARAHLDLTGAEVIVSLDSDFLLVEGDSVRLAREFADGRRVETPEEGMNRLYVVEPSFSTTGACADNRLRAKPSEITRFAQALLARLGRGTAPSGLSPKMERFVAAVADDLLAHRGRSAIVAGHRMPAEVHAAVAAANQALGNVGRTVSYFNESAPLPDAGRLADFARDAANGGIEAAFFLEVNPAHGAPADLEIDRVIAALPLSVHHGMSVDETALLCDWHLPASHPFEAWGDLATTNGVASIQQPMIQPLYESKSDVEVLGFLADRGEDGHALVRETWAGSLDDTGWERALFEGVIPQGPQGGGAPRSAQPRVRGGLTIPDAPGSPDGLELVFAIDATLLDGRWANNPWLQELPDPMTKITWDNAAAISPATARELGVESGDLVEITHDGRSITIGAWVTPGVADDTVILPLGYGRRSAGDIGNGVGFDVAPLRTSAAEWVARGASLARVGGDYEFATTQEHGTLDTDIENWAVDIELPERRSILRQATVEHYRENPDFVDELDILPPDKIHSLWDEPNIDDGHQWGMSIDLTTCVGCNACTIACQAENNIPVVGKDQVLNGREMHWIRLDRYYGGDPDEPIASHQPLPCMQCENAPCESVCPVAATVHSPEGLNDMAYNRCIGTRYCSNNCPYKVRRFNFFNYPRRMDEAVPMMEAQRNQNVTVRFRGVMEKCTYCVQRINAARADAKIGGNGVIPDGAIETACQEACPTNAIVFGDVNDPDSAVSRLKAQPRNYALLAELNTQPRTTYLAKLRNPNPALVDEVEALAADDGGH